MLLNGIEHTTNHVLVIKSQAQLNQLGEAALLADPDYNNSDLSHRLGNVTVEISFSVLRALRNTPIRTDASAAVVDAVLSEGSGKIPRIKAARLEKDMKLKEAKELVEFIELVEGLVIRKFTQERFGSSYSRQWERDVRVPSPLESCDEPLLD